MFERKKLLHILPHEKYKVLASVRDISRLNSQSCLFYNTFDNPTILAFRLFYRIDGLMNFEIDFKNNDAYERFLTFCDKIISSLLCINNSERLDKNYTQDITHVISCKIQCKNGTAYGLTRIEILHHIFNAINQVDIMDVECISLINKLFQPLVKDPILKFDIFTIPIFKEIESKLSSAYFTGTVVGFFSQLKVNNEYMKNFPDDIAREIRKYLKENDQLALVSRQCALQGSKENSAEADKIVNAYTSPRNK